MRFKPEKIFVKTSSGIYEELSYRQFCEANENNADFTKNSLFLYRECFWKYQKKITNYSTK